MEHAHTVPTDIISWCCHDDLYSSADGLLGTDQVLRGEAKQ